MKFFKYIWSIMCNCFKINKLEEEKELFIKTEDKKKIFLIIVTK